MHLLGPPPAHPCTQPSGGRLGRPGGTAAASGLYQSSALLVACSRGTVLSGKNATSSSASWRLGLQAGYRTAGLDGSSTCANLSLAHRRAMSAWHSSGFRPFSATAAASGLSKHSALPGRLSGRFTHVVKAVNRTSDMGSSIGQQLSVARHHSEFGQSGLHFTPRVATHYKGCQVCKFAKVFSQLVAPLSYCDCGRLPRGMKPCSTRSPQPCGGSLGPSA